MPNRCQTLIGLMKPERSHKALVTDATAADLRRAARGEIDTAEVMRNIYIMTHSFRARWQGLGGPPPEN